METYAAWKIELKTTSSSAIEEGNPILDDYCERIEDLLGVLSNELAYVMKEKPPAEIIISSLVQTEDGWGYPPLGSRSRRR